MTDPPQIDAMVRSNFCAGLTFQLKVSCSHVFLTIMSCPQSICFTVLYTSVQMGSYTRRNLGKPIIRRHEMTTYRQDLNISSGLSCLFALF